MSQIRSRIRLLDGDEWMGSDDWLEAFLKDHEVEAEAWKTEVFLLQTLVVFLRVKLPVKYHPIFFQKDSKFMRKDISLLGKDTCTQLHSMHLLGHHTQPLSHVEKHLGS